MKKASWLLLGAVLSVGWAIGAAYHQRQSDLASANWFSTYAYGVCSQTKALHHSSDLSSCEVERAKDRRVWLTGSWGNAAFAALAPLPVAWISFYVLLQIYRAQVAGFAATVPWKRLSVPQRLFVGFCVVVFFGAVLVGLLWVSALYTETKVPVVMPSASVTSGGSVVTAEGTWVRMPTGSTSEISNPLQTTKINCDHDVGKCSVATAHIDSGTMLNDLDAYDVIRWDDKSVVFGSVGLCVQEQFTIDLTSTAANVVHTVTRAGEDPICSADRGQVSDRLENGLDVYWKESRKARPWPLRVFQAAMGN